MARIYYYSQFGKKKLAGNFYNYDFDRSIYVIRIFFLDRRTWNFKDFELSRSIFFPGILGLILIPFGWFFIIVWFLGLLKVNYSVFQNFPNGFGKTNILNLLFINLKCRSVKIYFGKTVYYKLCILLLLFSQIFAIVFFLNWSRKFTIDISIFNFWNVVPFSFRLSYLFYILICISIPVVALFIHRTSKKFYLKLPKTKQSLILKQFPYFF